MKHLLLIILIALCGCEAKETTIVIHWDAVMPYFYYFGCMIIGGVISGLFVLWLFLGGGGWFGR